MKRIFSIIVTLSVMLCAHAQSITFGYYTGQEEILNWGTSKAETYSVAMKVCEASLVGGKLKQLKIPVNTGADKTTEYCAFVTKELKASSGKATGDIANIAFEATDEWVTVTLPEAYTITEEPFYVGYTMKVTSCTQVTSDPNSVPLRVIAKVADGAMMITTSRTYRKWTDISASIGGALAMQIVVEGDAIKENAVSVARVANKIVKRGDEGTTKATILNHGVNDVTSIDYEFAVAGTTLSRHLDVNISGENYGAATDITIDIPSISETGYYDGVLTITKVNGVENTSQQSSATNTVRVMNIVPIKRPLMEEYTGAWCGFCPAGFAGMKEMNERHPGDFVCASYHNMDAMQITTNYPNFVDAFPTAYLDRNHFTDAYLGDDRHDMGIEETWLRECDEYTPVNVSVSATLDVSTGNLDVNAQYEYCEDVKDTEYGVAYIITADGVTGKGTNWRQHNYFSPDFEGGAYTYMYVEGMEMFNEGPEYMYLEYDDVAIAQSHENGGSFDDILPASVAEATVVEHNTNFNTADMNSNYGRKENLVQNPEHLHAIALVYDKVSAHVLNCAKCDVTVDDPAGITTISSSDTPAFGSAAYNLAGQRVNALTTKGVIISNGRKVMR